jgi:putative ABC transport system substrate-binding protein
LFHSSSALLLDPKRLETLHELVPGVAVVAVLRNANSANAEAQVASLHDAERRLGIALRFVTAANEPEIDASFCSAR